MGRKHGKQLMVEDLLLTGQRLRLISRFTCATLICTHAQLDLKGNFFIFFYFFSPIVRFTCRPSYKPRDLSK